MEKKNFLRVKLKVWLVLMVVLEGNTYFGTSQNKNRDKKFGTEGVIEKPVHIFVWLIHVKS